MEQQGHTFVDGMVVRDRHPNTPSFVIANLACKVDDLYAFCEANKDQNGWVNITLKNSQGGKNYAVLDTWKPEQQ